ncbi:MAG: hypothetical protein L0229_02535 [Blastocatellia bacterium]|nr:hypothetical protein [Blastocatellia bacterium]
MSTTPLIDSDVIEEGWNILVEKLGLQKATRFVILLERGKGDSIQEIRDYWGDASVDEIHGKITAWKTGQQEPTS